MSQSRHQSNASDNARSSAAASRDGGDDAVLLAVRVKRRAPVSKIGGERDGRLLVHVTAAPVDGRANDAVCRVIAGALRIARGRVSVVGGVRARDKLVRVEGIARTEVAEGLGLSN